MSTARHSRLLLLPPQPALELLCSVLPGARRSRKGAVLWLLYGCSMAVLWLRVAALAAEETKAQHTRPELQCDANCCCEQNEPAALGARRAERRAGQRSRSPTKGGHSVQCEHTDSGEQRPALKRCC